MRKLTFYIMTATTLFAMNSCDMMTSGTQGLETDTLNVVEIVTLTDSTATEQPDTVSAEVVMAEPSPAKAVKAVKPETKPLKGTADGRTMPLTLTITGLISETAPIIMSFYVKEATFLEKKAQLRTYRFVPMGYTITVKVNDLDFGIYAIAAYQDVNSSGQIDRNFLGIPKEPYAFSNNIRPKAAAPKFKDCKFTYSRTAHVMGMKLVK